MSRGDRTSVPPSVGQVLSYFVTHPGAAHEVKTPLFAIASIAKLLSGSAENDALGDWYVFIP